MFCTVGGGRGDAHGFNLVKLRREFFRSSLRPAVLLRFLGEDFRTFAAEKVLGLRQLFDSAHGFA